MSFDFYRRRQREVLAILVLVAIFSFIVVPSMQLYMGDANSSANEGPTVVQWRGGKIQQFELVRMVQAKGQTVNFLAQVANEVIKRGGMPNVPGFRYDFQNSQIQSLGISGFVSQLAVARTKILNEKARQMGIVFDDVAIDTFLSDFVNSKLTKKELSDIMEKVSGGELTRFRLYQVLKLELSAQVMESTALAGMNSSGRPIMPPGQAWQYFDRLNRQARIEGFPIVVANYSADVKEEPSEAEITELFEKYKEQFSSPMVAEPGFRKRYQANLDVIDITPEPFILAEVAKLAPDQLRAEYDRRVGLGQYRRPVATTPPTTEPTTPPATAEAPAAPATPPETPAAPPATETPATPAPAETPATTETPATPADKPAEPAPATPETPAPATETPATETPAAEPKKDGDGSQASLDQLYPNPLRPRLVSFQEETPAAQPPAAETPAAETPAPTAQEPATTTAPPPVDPPPGLDTPPTAETPANTETPAAPVAPAAPAEEIIPFEEVKDEIARSMVLPLAREKMEAAVASVQKPMLQYFTEYGSYKVALEMDAKMAKEPTRPDIKKLAEAAGLPYRQTGNVDIIELIRTPLGRSRSTAGESFAELVFSDNLALYQPFRSLDFDFTAGKISEFLVWKLESKAAYVPDLSEVREQVVAAWKKQKAEKLAEAAAAELAKKLQTATGEDAWKSVVKEEQLPLVFKPTLFTWMSGANQFNPFLSEVEGVDTAGPEFMQKVFSTTAGQSGVAPNGPRTIYYVYRVLEFLPEATELEKRFSTDTVQGAARSLAFSDAQEMFASWYSEVEKELDVKWVASDAELD
jgi:hypothetical protein